MIFLVVGTQAPFDRLVRCVDAWAASPGRPEVVAQIGHAGYSPRHLRARAFMSPAECREYTAKSDLVVAHAGMGTILSALELGKPVIVMPRRADAGEHRNDHQLATADRLGSRGLVRVAESPEQLTALLSAHASYGAVHRIRPFASESLIHGLRNFLHGVADGSTR